MPTKPQYSHLNGIWTATYNYVAPQPVLNMVGHPMGGTHFILRDGIVAGSANGGTVFHGEILNLIGDTLSFTLTTSGKYHDPDVGIFDPSLGHPTNGTVVQSGELQLTPNGDTLYGSGSIVAGPLTIEFVMRRVALLSH